MITRLIVILLCGFGTCFSSFSQIDAFFDTKYFNTEDQPYVDVMLEFYAPSLKYAINEKGEGSCKIEITQILKKQDSIVQFDKYILTNGNQDTSLIYENVIDLKRYSIDNKVAYEMEISILDLNDTAAEAQSLIQSVQANFSNLQAEFSSIQLVESYAPTKTPNLLSKSGNDIVPLVNDYFSPDFNKIAFYYEAYHTIEQFGEGGKFILTHYIENTKTGEIAGNYSKLKRQTAQKVIPMLQVFEISSLPTGSYNIVAEIRNKENEVIVAERTPFSRVSISVNTDPTFLRDVNYKNSFVELIPADSLDEFIYCLNPIVGQFEGNLINKRLPIYSDSLKRQFIYSFWYNQDNQNPELAWNNYYKEVMIADKLFSTKVKRGYETERGRVYLKYGKPNSVEDRPNEPSSYPYQIWHYYKIGQWNNKRFIFYQPDLVTNDYELLHSDLTGELQNKRWQSTLNKRNSPGGNLDDENEGNFNHYGSRENVLFNNP
jgi:GWxTD domain-containing protein